jgi:hypothetical protein
MTSTKYIGMDVHKESISVAVMNATGKIVMECVIETKASMILQCIDGLRGDLHVPFEEGTSAAWLYDLLKPHVTELIVCDPRKNASMREDYSERMLASYDLRFEPVQSLIRRSPEDYELNPRRRSKTVFLQIGRESCKTLLDARGELFYKLRNVRSPVA